MSRRRLLTLELVRTPPERRVREYTGAALARVRLEHARAGRWNSRCLVCVVVAMAFPMSIAGTVMTLDMARVQDPLLTLATLAMIWLPCVVMPMIWFCGDWWYRQSLAKRTRFYPYRLDGPLMRYVWLVFPAVLLLVILPIWSLLTPEPLTQDLVDNSFVIETVALMLAGVLVAHGVFDRFGETVTCRRCGYPIPSDDLQHPGVCNECGRDLAHPGGLALGEAVRRPVSFTLGLAIIAAGVVFRLLA